MEKTAIITGGARRLGKEMALSLAQDGYNIALCYQNSHDEAQATCAQIEQGKKSRCSTFELDLRNTEAVCELVAHVCAKLPPPTLLINNASVFHERRFGAIKEAEFDADFAVNFKAPFFLVQSFAGLGGDGLVINLLDGNITKNIDTHFDYLLAKKALHAFTEMAAFALAPRIRVNAIAPGPMLPPAGQGLEYLKAQGKAVPMKVAGHPNQVVAAINYLVTNTYVTGQTIFVDGGLHL